MNRIVVHISYSTLYKLILKCSITHKINGTFMLSIRASACALDSSNAIKIASAVLSVQYNGALRKRLIASYDSTSRDKRDLTNTKQTSLRVKKKSSFSVAIKFG